MIISVLSIVINWGAASVMVRSAGLGHAGLALSTSAVALFAFLVQFGLLRRRIGGIRRSAVVSDFSHSDCIPGYGGSHMALEPGDALLVGRVALG